MPNMARGHDHGAVATTTAMPTAGSVTIHLLNKTQFAVTELILLLLHYFSENHNLLVVQLVHFPVFRAQSCHNCTVDANKTAAE